MRVICQFDESRYRLYSTYICHEEHRRIVYHKEHVHPVAESKSTCEFYLPTRDNEHFLDRTRFVDYQQRFKPLGKYKQNK